MMNEYQERQEAKRKRFEAKARKLEAESQQRFRAAVDPVVGLQGEPIKIGHYSEGRHRRLLERSDVNMRKSIEADKKAAHYQNKADSVGYGGISSDDPEARDKIQARITDLQNSQEYMKSVNAAWRKAKKPTADDAAGWQKVANILGENLEQLNRIRVDFARDSLKRPPFATYVLSNNSANIARLKKRLESLAVVEKAESVDQVINGVRVLQNTEMNRIQLFFNGKPDADTRLKLKRFGFRWSPSQNAWQRHLNGNGIYAVKQFFYS